MGIPPWILAIIVLVGACYMGASIIHSFKLFPNETPISSPLPVSEGWQNDEDSEDAGASAAEGAVEGGAGSAAGSATDVSGLDQNIFTATTPVGYAVATNTLLADKDEVLQNILPNIRAAIGRSHIIPNQKNLDMISGGSNQPANKALVQEHQPNIEKIAPHEQLPKHKPQMVANVPTDQGTEAEEIQSNSYATRSVRQNIREEESLKEESFTNPFRIRYTRV